MPERHMVTRMTWPSANRQFALGLVHEENSHVPDMLG
jgi:hypothetical protein